LIPVRVAWERGGEATLVSVVEDRLVFHSAVAAPPGFRMRGTLSDPKRTVLHVKVNRCQLRPEGDYLLEGRALDLRREARTWLEVNYARDPAR
jgi:hypothetical protein